MKATLCAWSLLGCAGLGIGKNVVQLDLRRWEAASGLPLSPHGALRGREAWAQTLVNNVTGGGYYAAVEVGTPGQQMSLLLDTGSSDAWVLGHNADLCVNTALQRQYQDSCGPQYTPSQSSTYKLVSAGSFQISYIGGQNASGDWVSDTLQIGGMSITNLQMGVASHTVSGVGVLGIGYSQNEASRTTYPNIMDQMVSQGLIGMKAYSLYLNDVRAASGSILFGGLDTARFIGSLQRVPLLVNTMGQTASFFVALSGLSIASNGATTSALTSTTAVPALLDSGTTVSYFPASIASRIFAQLDTYTDNRFTGYTFINCDYLTSSGQSTYLNFTLGGSSRSPSATATITVPISSLVLDILSSQDLNLLPTSSIPFTNVCVSGIQSNDAITANGGTATSDVILGQTFLRSAYVVYNLDGKEVGLAQANLNVSDKDNSVVELGSGTTTLPAVTGVAGQQTSAVVGAPTTAALSRATGTAVGTATTTMTTTSTMMSGTTASSGDSVVTVTFTPSPSASSGAARSMHSRGAGWNNAAHPVILLAGLGAFLGWII